MNNHITNLGRMILTACALVFMSLATSSEAEAQYCDWSDCTTYNSTYMGWLDQVTVKDGNGNVVMNRESNFENNPGLPRGYYVGDTDMEMKLGAQYSISLWGEYTTSYYYYRGQGRVFIDWNANAEFEASEGEYLGRTGYGYYMYFDYRRNGDNYYDTREYTFNTQVPCDAVTGETRMRTTFGYYFYHQSSDACYAGPSYCDQWGYQYIYGDVEDYNFNIVPDAPASFPTQGSILVAGDSYNGDTPDRPTPSLTWGSATAVGTIVSFKIIGPLPSTATVWEAVEPGTTDNTIEILNSGVTDWTPTEAMGSGVVNTNGFKGVKGGEYRAIITVGGAGCPGDVIRPFTVSWDHDVAASKVVSPKTNVYPRYFKYKEGTFIKLLGEVQNVGLNDVEKFSVTAVIKDSDGNVVNEIEYDYDSANPEHATLAPGAKYEVDFGNWRSFDIDIYSMSLVVDYAADLEAYNDYVPRPDLPTYTFEIAYDVQLQSTDILSPFSGETIKTGRPYNPVGLFTNVGISDISDVDAKMTVTDANNDVVYTSQIVVPDIAQGRYNTQKARFEEMAITAAGAYTACIEINHTDDLVTDDNTYCHDFVVEAGLIGEFTLGTLNETDPGYSVDGNFETFKELTNALYYDGITGDLVIKLTDKNYTLTGTADEPALDLSSKIIGLGKVGDGDEINTLTFEAADNRRGFVAGVTLELVSESGMGIRFGQNHFPTNDNAIVRTFPVPANANNGGYITFDGGSQKAIKLMSLSSNDHFAAPVFMDRGSNNIKMTNLIIDNGNMNLKNKIELPNVVYSPTNGFTYDPNVKFIDGAPNGASAGVLIRSRLMEAEDLFGALLDTTAANNNEISYNEITNFGYGVSSLGYGPLFITGDGKHARFYNNNNNFSNNTIHDVARAGIFLGFEENSTVANNRIWSVGNDMIDAAGIMLGGLTNDDARGYHNVGINVNGNEISGVSSNSMATGIRVEQVRTAYESGNSTPDFFPNVDTGMLIKNNTVHGINGTDGRVSRAGIHLFSERGNDLMTGMDTDFSTTGDMVVNNTIVIGSTGMDNEAVTIGLGIQNINNAIVYNNAIAIEDANIAGNETLATAILYQGVTPFSTNGLKSNRNAYWFGTDVAADAGINLFRMIELDAEGNTVDAGYSNRFSNLSQWRALTGKDASSVYGNFTQDLEMTGAIAPLSYRVKTNPTPLNSILNNRGDRLSYVSNGIDGDNRGQAGQRFDIGADEFNGRLHVTDLEVVDVKEPAVYRSTTGSFTDANYVMGKAPFTFTMNVRNNGSVQQAGSELTASLFMQQADGSYSDTPDYTEIVLISAESNNNTTAMFTFGEDGFTPMTYSDLNDKPEFVVPTMFSEMTANVSPIYKLRVETVSDQQNNNNVLETEYRYYMFRSNLDIILTGEMINEDLTVATTEGTVSTLNFDALEEGFTSLGYEIDVTDTDLSDRVYHYDRFDRNSWEALSVNYNDYVTLFWADGYNNNTNRVQRADVTRFMNSLNEVKFVKKNLIVASEELSASGDNSDFMNNILRVTHVGNDVMGNGDSYEGNTVIGSVVAQGYEVAITQPMDMTATPVDVYANDMAPMPAELMLTNTSVDNLPLPGLAEVAFTYNVNNMDQVMGVATATPDYNVVYFGLDWRNFGDMETMMRAVIDYNVKNGSPIVPVELTEFNANVNGNTVVLDWMTASEIDFNNFVVEKANVLNGNASEFTSIANVKAVGNSKTSNFYSLGNFVFDRR